MTEAQMVLELAAACLGGFLLGGGAGYLLARNVAPAGPETVMYDHDGHMAKVTTSEVSHWLLKGHTIEKPEFPTEESE